MKLTLQITASASTLATILASLPADATVDAPNAPSTPIGSGMPDAPVMVPSPPSMAVPTPPAPSLPTPPSDDDETGPAAEGTPDRDANGLPWDERIHSAGKNRLNTDGTWRKRRGVDDATVASVEQELRGFPHATTSTPPAMEIPQQPIPLPPTIPAVPTAAPVPQPIPAPAPMQDAVNAAMGMPTAPPPVPAPAAPWTPGSLDFLGVMQHLGPKFNERDPNGAPLIHADYLAQLTSEISTAFIQSGHIQQPLNAFTDIQGNQQMVDYAVQLFMRDQRW